MSAKADRKDLAFKNPDAPVYSAAVVAALVTLAMITVVAAWVGAIWNAASAAGFLAVFLIFLWRARLPPKAVLAVAAWAVVFNAAGWVWNLFHPVWGYDEAAHALGTGAATLITAYYGFRPLLGTIWIKHVFSVSLAVFSLGIMLGAYWEVAEWLGVHLFGKKPYNILEDVVSDLACDTLGAFVSLPFAYWAYTTTALEKNQG